MTIKELQTDMNCRAVWNGWEDREVTGAYTSDLLSDVMARSEEGQVLITIQAHKNTVAVAVLKDLSGIIIASNRPVPDDMIEAARDEEIPVFVTDNNQYETGWRIHELGGF